MDPSSTSHYKLFHGSERILLAFAIYGLVAGIITFIDSTSYEQDIWATLSIVMNVPTGLAFYTILGGYAAPVPTPIWSFFIVMGSIIVWSTVGFIVYCFYRIFKLGPYEALGVLNSKHVPILTVMPEMPSFSLDTFTN